MMISSFKTILSKVFGSTKTKEANTRREDVKLGSVSVKATEDSSGVKEYLKDIQKGVITDHDTGMALALSLIHGIANKNNSTSRFLLSCDIVHDGDNEVMFTNEQAVISAYMGDQWRVFDRKKLPISLAPVAIREYTSLMASDGWVCTHDSEQISTDFMNSAIGASVRENIARYEQNMYDCSVGVKVQLCTANPQSSNSQPYIEIGVFQRIKKTITPATMTLKFHKVSK